MKLTFTFDVGHSSIGWSVISPKESEAPDILGCGVVLFEKDSALANQRRLHRSQRRHVRATRHRIARLEKLLAHLGVISASDLAAKHVAAGGHAAPWLLAARVLASDGAHTLTWIQLWDVLRWYAHNRGYDPLTMMSDDPDPEDTLKVTNAREAMKAHDKNTMAETICAWLGLDPLGEKSASLESYKAKDAAFPRHIVQEEVRRILTAHVGKLPAITPEFIAALLDQAHALPCPDIRLPKRYQGGLLFGRLALRYHNRIIGHCPLSGEKLPLKDCPEFYRFRWAMLLANISVTTDVAAGPRPLSAAERRKLTDVAAIDGYFTPGEFIKTVRALTGSVRDNLEQMFMDATAKNNLVLDPARHLVTANKFASAVWPQLPEPVRRHALNRWRRGAKQSLGELRAEAEAAGHDLAAFDAALATVCAAPPKKTRSKKEAPPPPTPAEVLARPLSAARLGGRAPFARPLLVRAYEQALADPPVHPRVEGGCLFETPEQRRARESRSIDQQTNNHLVRHRLAILGRLLEHLIAAPAYANGDASRVARLVLEVNRDLREMAGMTAQDIAKEMNERLRNHAQVSKKLEAPGALPPGTRVTASLIRKARIADDLGWRCPYTGFEFSPVHLVTRQVDLDHIIPRSLRASDSLDSLVVTFSSVNRMKGALTAREFIEKHQTQPILDQPGFPNLHIMEAKRYEAFVESLDTRGHPDDARRKKRRKERLLLASYDEKSGGFTPGQLTQTSQLSRLGQQVLRKPFENLAAPPAFVALPGQLTARARAAWSVLGCLAEAAPGILEMTTDPDGRERREVKTKTEIRGITHLHHALDACVLGLAAERFPNRGDVWRALIERRPNPAQRAQLEALDLGDFDASGGFRLRDLPETLKAQIRHRLAERRVVQHVPADMSGMKAKQNIRGIADDSDPEFLVLKPGIGDDGTKQKRPERVLRSKVLGLQPGKLKQVKGVQVLSANFGVAILADSTLAQEARFVVIPHIRVWHQLRALSLRNGGRQPLVWRNGRLIRVPSGPKAGLWRICSIKNSAEKGVVLDLARADELQPTWREVILRSLIKAGVHQAALRFVGESDAIAH
jgi:CRISPR-associated endonuclease Csn1